MKKTFLFIMSAMILCLFVSCGKKNTPEIPSTKIVVPEGAVKGLFSVAYDKQVYFSQGNLQFNATRGGHVRADGTSASGTWRFALNQYDAIGEANQFISSTYDGWIDLFGWGTSGYKNTAIDPHAIYYHPWSVNYENELFDDNDFGYGPSDIDLVPQNIVGQHAFYDWGVYNPISNGGELTQQWRTLTASEWRILFNVRNNAQKLRGQAIISSAVKNIYGYVLLPDNWVLPQGLHFTPCPDNWSSNIYSVSEWTTMEDNGAVFLPCTGFRHVKEVKNAELGGGYWASSQGLMGIGGISFYESNAVAFQGYSDGSYAAADGHAVRLVQDVK